jgi:hypothetical protein
VHAVAQGLGPEPHFSPIKGAVSLNRASRHVKLDGIQINTYKMTDRQVLDGIQINTYKMTDRQVLA